METVNLVPSWAFPCSTERLEMSYISEDVFYDNICASEEMALQSHPEPVELLPRSSKADTTGIDILITIVIVLIVMVAALSFQ